jgi:imidazolonepropionase-like amidohydrolase
MIAIVGGTIIDGNGGPPVKNGVILIQGERIIWVGEQSTVTPPKAKRISATGKYIIPALMDANVHLYAQHTGAELIRNDGRYEAVITEAAQVTLKNGLTSVFDTWGPRAALTRVRDQVNRGEIVGSRIFFAGNIIGLGGPTTTDFFPTVRAGLSECDADAIDARWEQGVGPDLLWMTPREVRARIRDYVESGHQDFLKYAASGHAHPQYICFSAEVQRTIVEVAHHAGMTVQTHSTTPESLRMAIEAGADLLQHPDLTGKAQMPEATLAVIAQRKIPCAALFVTRRFLAWNDAYMPEPLVTNNRNKDQNDHRLVAAGATILLTTDSVILAPTAADDPMLAPLVCADDAPLLMGEAHFRWLEAAYELGMEAMDVLMAATRNVAKAYKVDQDLGTLEKGKIADLLILDRNPLEAAGNYRSINLVMKEGKVIDRDSLPTRRVLTTQIASHGDGSLGLASRPLIRSR